MGCTRCGTDARLIELMFNKLMYEALEDGTLQAGLVSCSDKKLEKNTGVVICTELRDKVCELIEGDEVCIATPTALSATPNKEDPTYTDFSLVMSDGSVLTTKVKRGLITEEDAVALIQEHDKSLNSVSYSKTTRNLTFTVGSNVDGESPKVLTVNLADLKQVSVGDGLAGNGTEGNPLTVKLSNSLVTDSEGNIGVNTGSGLTTDSSGKVVIATGSGLTTDSSGKVVIDNSVAAAGLASSLATSGSGFKVENGKLVVDTINLVDASGKTIIGKLVNK